MNENALDITIPKDLYEQFEREAKSANFISTEAYILHLLEKERMKYEASERTAPKGVSDGVSSELSKWIESAEDRST